MQFRCSRCGSPEPLSTVKACCSCGGLWDLDFQPGPFSLEAIDRSQWSLFRYRAFMALEGDAWKSVSLGEGLTPVMELKEGLWAKVDYAMATLSFKDRGAAALIAHCKALGVKKVLQDSSGNAGNSVAAYCARAGIECEIFVPQGTSPAKIAMIESHGAKCTLVSGTRDHCAEVCRSKVQELGLYYGNHVYNPLFYEGTKTYIYEVFEQLGRIPAHLVIPVGNGTLFLGVVYGLEHLLASGAIEAFPQIIAVQSEHCDPLYRAASRGETVPAELSPKPTMAEGIAIGRPLRGPQILALAKKHGVRFVQAPEGRILEARNYLARRGFYCEHTTAANLAGYWRYCQTYGPAPDCLLPLCGAGLKSDH